MKWTRRHVIGQGSSGTVYAATSPNSPELFAVKSAELCRSVSLRREAEILRSIRSRHVVSCLGAETTRDPNNTAKLVFNLFLEFVPGGALSDQLRRRGQSKGLEEETIRRLCRGILRGLEHLHGLGIAHCDIKGSNVLITEDGEPKIADFGCARRFLEDDHRIEIAGSPMFMAPEVARGEARGMACDIWSLGCTVIEMTGRSPWPSSGDDPAVILYRIACSDEAPVIPESFSPEAKDFLRRCLRRDPAERWTATELLKHPFVDRRLETPTSVLDRRRDWEEDYFSEICLGFGSDILDGSDSTAMERIRRLAGTAASCSSLDGPDWITIRSINDEESRLSDDYGVLSSFDCGKSKRIHGGGYVISDDLELLDCSGKISVGLRGEMLI